MKVYTASKLSQAPLWSRLKKEWTEIEFTARWVTEHIGVTEKNPVIARQFWIEDFQDVQAADVVLLYGEPHEKQRGSLVEAGMAIGMQKPVIVCGDSADFGTWQYFPSVHRVTTLNEAREILSDMANARKKL